MADIREVSRIGHGFMASRALFAALDSTSSLGPPCPTLLSELGMMSLPPVRDIDATREPYPILAAGVVEKLAQRSDAGRLPDQARMESDGHHPRMGFTLDVELVEASLQSIDEVARRAVARQKAEPCVVVREGKGTIRCRLPLTLT